MPIYVMWREHDDESGALFLGCSDLEDVFPHLLKGFNLEAVVRCKEEMMKVVSDVYVRLGYDEDDTDDMKIWGRGEI